ncbi:zinc finger protein 454-like isoform X2 [Anopheles stephensi]|uniref:zinc finger protein 454-like isoform X2 n=1 Tax=Anopheles stephensi TaxID=30069 RepID=UPI001658ADD1|nr:zinc finger protein 454-like isoform X2 [Anopheles stephensi]
MSSLHAKIENICRLCLSGDDTLESIFGDSGSDALQTIIYDCTSIRIQPKLGLPSSICSACRSKVENFHEFRERCLHNDEYLRTTLELVTPKQDHDDEYEEDQDDDGEEEEEEDVDIKLEPEVLLDEQSDVDPKEDDEKGGDMIVDRNDNKIERASLGLSDGLNGGHGLDRHEPEQDEWDEAGSNDLDSIGNSSTESFNFPYLSPDPTYGSLLKCEFCSLEFSVLEQLKRHITSHKEERIFQCYYCPKTFHFAKNLNMHVEYIHSKAKYTPSQVAKMIARQQSLVHSSSSNNSTVSQSTNGGLSPLSPLLDTSDCLNNNTIPSSTGIIDAGAGLSLNINLNGNTTTSNGTNGTSILGRNLKPIRLPALGSTVGEGRRGSSVPSIGSSTGQQQQQQHECHVCHKSYSESSALRQHMLVHTGEKPYKCDICSKSFYNASTLKTHQRIHSDHNPYRCGTCTKMFDNARSLELHHRTHTGEKPYACDVCLKKFSCSSNLKRHRKLHDRD